MDSMSYNFAMEDQKPSFSTAGETKATTDTGSYASSDHRSMTSPSEGVFSPLAPPFQGRTGNDLLTLLSQQEPRQGDTAPTAAEVDMLSFRLNSTLGSDLLFDDVEQNSSTLNHNYYMGGSRTESVSSSNMWPDGSAGVSSARNGEMIDTFDFLVKSLSSANNYVSMLTREQLSVLRSIRPSVLYEFLQEVAKVRGDKRLRRALPSECAFCKNNGENEECYSSHALKDWRGRVLCPVLRAFRCPRCGATGDRAHTIKYCQESADNAAPDRLGLSRRRGQPPTSLLLGGASSAGPAPGLGRPPHSPHTPAPSPSPGSAGLSHSSSLWSNFSNN